VRDRRLVVALGAAAVLIVAAALFSRFGIHGMLSRDESIYAYGGQQVEDGTPFYVSIFDQKTPGAAYLAAMAVAIGNTFGMADIDAIRVTFFIAACLTVVAVYLLALELWGSVPAALVAAVTFASFRGFALDALGGPDAKTPGILLAVLAMLLLARRRWFWAGMCGALAFLVWQPLAVYLAVGLVVAERRRLVALGTAVPLAALSVYFWITGAFGDFVQAAFVFPVEGLYRRHETVGERVTHIARIVDIYYHGAVVQFWAGLALLVVLSAVALWQRRFRDPLVRIVLPTFAVIAAFSALDFQGYPDVYPLLPYAALGLAGAVAYVVRVPVLRPAAVAAAALAVAVAWTSFSTGRAEATTLMAQETEATAIQRLLAPGDTILALGDPTPLVLTDRANASRYIFLSSGVAAWQLRSMPHGFDGWMQQIHAENPAVIVLHGWHGRLKQQVGARLRAEYVPAYVGCWRVFLRPDVASRAATSGVALGRHKCQGPT
jgi:4-amino-4-deoxy-L-arabinose transferase-like glycosyltransferase